MSGCTTASSTGRRSTSRGCRPSSATRSAATRPACRTRRRRCGRRTTSCSGTAWRSRPCARRRARTSSSASPSTSPPARRRATTPPTWTPPAAPTASRTGSSSTRCCAGAIPRTCSRTSRERQRPRPHPARRRAAHPRAARLRGHQLLLPDRRAGERPPDGHGVASGSATATSSRSPAASRRPRWAGRSTPRVSTTSSRGWPATTRACRST